MSKIKIFLFTLLTAPVLAAATPAQVGGGWDNGPEVLGLVGEIGFGLSIAKLEDYNLDGVTDILIGAPGKNNGTGGVYLYDGATSTMIWLINGDVAGDRFGTEISALGDMNGDGHPEMLMTAPGTNGFTGSVYVFDGLVQTNNTVINGTELGGNFGDAVETLPDMDGDGYNDFIIGADKVDNPSPPGVATGIDSGAIYIYSGKTLNLIAPFYGYEDDSRFGSSVAPLGDLNGDLIPEILVGAKGTEVDLGAGIVPDVGRAWVLSGADFSVVHVVVGETQSGFFGSSVANAGDVNGDGLDDFIVAAQEYSDPIVGTECGAVYVYSGADGSLMRKYIGENPGDKFGGAIWGNVDVNNDGRLDILIGAPIRDLFGQSGSFAGGIYAYSGNGDTLLNIAGSGFRERLGSEIEVMEDKDGDGYPEFFVSAPEYRPSGVHPRVGRLMNWEFDPYMFLDNNQVSAVNGGFINFNLAFPIAEANRNYQILFSLGTGPVYDGQVGIPLSPGNLFFRTKGGDYNFLTMESGMIGTLDANAEAVAWIDQANIPPALIGNIYYVAAVTMDALGASTDSSSALAITIVP
jgi:FG-GAP repeat protein